MYVNNLSKITSTNVFKRYGKILTFHVEPFQIDSKITEGLLNKVMEIQ